MHSENPKVMQTNWPDIHESQTEAPPAYHPLPPQKAVNIHHPTLDCMPAITTSHGSHGKRLISKANSHLKCSRQDLSTLN